MPIKFEKHITLQEPQSILDCLYDNTELSRQQLKKLMQNGAVWLENAHGINRIRRAKKNLNENDLIHVYYDETIQSIIPPLAELITDEGGYSIWNKPSGMYSQGTKWGDHCSIYRWAEQNLQPQRQAFLVHRLDKSANGLIVVAHKKSIAASFSKMFEQRQVHKKYRATVQGLVEDLQLPYEVKNRLDDRIAISEIISVLKDNSKNQSIIEIVIKTGRKHQIRRHLSGLGHPIVGDRLYGADKTHLDLQLSSIELEFICPVSAEKKKFILS